MWRPLTITFSVSSMNDRSVYMFVYAAVKSFLPFVIPCYICKEPRIDMYLTYVVLNIDPLSSGYLFSTLVTVVVWWTPSSRVLYLWHSWVFHFSQKRWYSTVCSKRACGPQILYVPIKLKVSRNHVRLGSFFLKLLCSWMTIRDSHNQMPLNMASIYSQVYGTLVLILLALKNIRNLKWSMNFQILNSKWQTKASQSLGQSHTKVKPVYPQWLFLTSVCVVLLVPILNYFRFLHFILNMVPPVDAFCEGETVRIRVWSLCHEQNTTEVEPLVNNHHEQLLL